MLSSECTTFNVDVLFQYVIIVTKHWKTPMCAASCYHRRCWIMNKLPSPSAYASLTSTSPTNRRQYHMKGSRKASRTASSNSRSGFSLAIVPFHSCHIRMTMTESSSVHSKKSLQNNTAYSYSQSRGQTAQLFHFEWYSSVRRLDNGLRRVPNPISRLRGFPRR